MSWSYIIHSFNNLSFYFLELFFFCIYSFIQLIISFTIIIIIHLPIIYLFTFYGYFSRCSVMLLLRYIISNFTAKFHLILWHGKFAEKRSFRRVLGRSPETLRKLYLSAKFPHQEIRSNFSILDITYYIIILL